MEYKVIHTTEYIYEKQVGLCHNITRLMPRTTERQICKKITVDIEPEPDIVNEYEDFFGNKVMYFSIQKPHSTLRITVSSDIVKTRALPLELKQYGNAAWEDVRMQLYEYRPEHLDARQFIPETPMTASSPAIISYALQSFTPRRSIFEASQDLMQRIFRDFRFESGQTTVSTPLWVVMQNRRGVCQDFAHLAIACIRSLGLPAKYMSGYIETVPAPGNIKLFGADASHAWFAVFIPNLGWIELDPTNNQMPSDQHITIGWGRDYADINPLKGIILTNGEHKLKVSVDVRRV